MKPGPKPQSLLERFNEKWMPEPFSGCWLWLAGINSTGYGQINAGVTRLAHRVSWELYRGALPTEMDVLHSCDTTICVNPWHLFLGTALTNALDSIKKGRWGYRGKSGASHHAAKLTDDAVRFIRASSEPLLQIATRFGVTIQAVSEVRLRKTWRHIQ